MADQRADRLTITAEHYLGPLNLPDLEGGVPERRQELFAAIVEYLAHRDLLEALDDRIETDPTEVHLRIPGTPIHVRAGAVGEPELREIVTLVGGLGLVHDPITTITLTGLLALRRLVQVLKTEYGERSVVESLREAHPPTVAAVSGILHGAPCRHARAGCQFDREGICTIDLDAVAATLADLVDRNVLRRLNAVEPYEYAVRW